MEIKLEEALRNKLDSELQKAVKKGVLKAREYHNARKLFIEGESVALEELTLDTGRVFLALSTALHTLAYQKEAQAFAVVAAKVIKMKGGEESLARLLHTNDIPEDIKPFVAIELSPKVRNAANLRHRITVSIVGAVAGTLTAVLIAVLYAAIKSL